MNKHFILSAAFLVFAVSSASAQTFQEGLFLEENRTAFRFNPAAAGNTDFLSVGNFMNGGIANFGSNDFASASCLEPDNRKTGDIYYNLFSYGFAKDGAFHTIEANVRNLFTVGFARDLFSFAEGSSSDDVYDISGTGLSDNLYSEIAYGYSRKLSDIVTVGARARLLLGLNSASYQITSMGLRTGGEQISLNGSTELYLTRKKWEIDAEDGETVGFGDIHRKPKSLLPTGVGLAADLGVVITPDEYLTISASLLDMGGILWHYGNVAVSEGSLDIDFLEEEEEFLDDDFGELLGHFGEMAGDLIDIVQLIKKPAANVLRAVPMNANLGLKYKFPFYDALSVGITGNFTRYTGISYLESRFGVGLSPWDWLSVTGNAGYGTFGAVWGAGASVRAYRFRFNVGVENYFGGTVPARNTPLEACRKLFSAGLTFDL